MHVRLHPTSHSNTNCHLQVRGVGAAAEFIRLVLHRPHPNRLNGAAQGGLMALRVTGSQAMVPALRAVSDRTLAAFEQARRLTSCRRTSDHH